MDIDMAKSIKTRVHDRLCHAIAGDDLSVELAYLQQAHDALTEIIEDMETLMVTELRRAA